MSYSSSKKALNAYGNSSARSEAHYASPHRLVQILLDGLLAKLAVAKGYIDRSDFAGKGQELGAALSIIGALKGSLDLSQGGEIAANLDDLYGYMSTRLLEANVKNDSSVLDEVMALLVEIKSAWDAMPDEVKNMPRQQLQSSPQAAVAGR
jgi:flagellar protein FliS